MAHRHAYINPDILKWARERARFTIQDAAHVVNKLPSRYEAWEQGADVPTLAQARKLAIAFHRSLAFFYLDNPPAERDIPAELRRLAKGSSPPLSKELAAQIRLAAERRSLAISLYDELGEVVPNFSLTANIDENPETVAQKARELLGISTVEQFETELTSTPKLWRGALENVGILVFQIPGVDHREMHGFSIAERPLPIIAFNSQTTYTRRVFTMFHELGHILLKDSVLHQNDVLVAPASQKEELFCNRFAAAFLVPSASLLSDSRVELRRHDGLWTDNEIKGLSRDFGVSRSVIIRRLHHHSLIDDQTFRKLRQQYDVYKSIEKSTDSEGKSQGGDTYKNRIVHIGGLLSRLAFRNYYYNNWTIRDLSALFNLRASSLGGMEHEVFGRNYGFEK